MLRQKAWLCGFGAAFFVTSEAAAYEAAVDASVDAQLYQVTSPFGNPVLRRRRYTEMLTLRMHDLQGQHAPDGAELSALARLRVDSDLGVDSAERTPSREDRFVPGTSETTLDVMALYVEGRRYADGLVGFRIGRQYVVDALGFWSFDGGLVRLETPAYFAVEAYGGMEQRGGLYLLGTPRFEADGVLRGNRRGMDPAVWPEYLDESRVAPAYGFAVESANVAWLDTRVTYRKVVNRDAVVVAPFADARGEYPRVSDDRVSTEKVGWAGAATAPELGTVSGNFVYDALASVPSRYGASLEWFATHAIGLGADVDYFLPTFDGDSIWNWFSHGGTTTMLGRVRWDATRRLSFAASGGLRRFAAAETTGTLVDLLGSADAAYRYPEGDATLRLADEHGDRGHLRGADLGTRRYFQQKLWEASVLVSFYDWGDGNGAVALRDPDRLHANVSSFTYVLGGAMRPFPRTRFGLEWEHSMNEVVGQRFRALATLDVTVY